jgi:hydrogenase expression/formation protein HypD
MKYLDEYRDGDIAAKIVAEMRRIQTRPWVLMEVCGGQTHSIVKNGLDHLLPEGVELVHGPGCPVCVTPLEMIDKAHAIARMPNVIFCSFGDMLRVPGADGDHRVLATRLPEDRPRQSGEASCFLCHRLRDHGSRQRDAGVASSRRAG